MKRFSIALFLVMFSAVAMTVPVRAATSRDASFVRRAQSDALGSYALAALARGRAKNPAVRALAVRMVGTSDHTNLYVRSYASHHDIKLTNKPVLRATAQYGNIAGAHGAAFDRAFTNAIYIDANIALGTYQSEARHGDDPALRSFAAHQAAYLEKLSATAKKLRN